MSASSRKVNVTLSESGIARCFDQSGAFIGCKKALEAWEMERNGHGKLEGLSASTWAWLAHMVANNMVSNVEDVLNSRPEDDPVVIEFRTLNILGASRSAVDRAIAIKEMIAQAKGRS